MSIDYIMDGEHDEPTNTPDDSSSQSSSDSEDSPFSESETVMPSVTEPDVSLDEMLSLACRQGKLDIVQLLLQSGAHVNHRNKAGNTPLLEACSQGHVSVADYLLENGSKIDAPTESTLDSALTWACTLGNSNIVDTLLYKNANVEHRTKDGCTALMFACLAGHHNVAEKLLDANSEINVESDSNKDSPLTFACWKGHFDVVTLLLDRKANIEHRTKEGFSPLMFAALGGHTKVARKLLETKAEVNVPSGSNNDIPLTSACWKGHEDVVKLLLEFNSCIEHRTKDGCTPLMLAAREGHLKVAELLLKNNAEVNVPSGSENNIPLTLACWKGHWEVVQLLLDFNSDIEHRNKAGCTPLMLAAREGHYETTILLLEKDAKVNVPSGSNDDTPLTLACWKGHKEVVMLLLDSKSNIDHQTKTGCTPLMEATREGHRDVAEILLDHNADVELPDNYGQSPLFMACWKGHKNVAELLLQKGAYRDCRTKTGITPLFQACRENHVSIVELLLTHGAGVNNPFPNSRENPLTLCAEKGHKKLVELLLLKGASLDCRTKKGCTPEFLACKEGHMDIAQMLAEHGANLETADCRSNTPMMAAYKNGHVAIVSWLIKHVHHLPSDELCHKILMSAVDGKEKEVIVQKRSKCLAIIQETKKKRELLALRNAQNLVQELDDEKNREETKKKKKAAKRRDKNNKRKKSRENEKVVAAKFNGLLADGEEDDDEDENEDDEENKDNLLPTENRDYSDEKPELETLTNDITSRLLVHENPVDMTSTKSSSRKKNRKKSERSKKVSKDENIDNTDVECRTKNVKNAANTSLIFSDLPMKTFAETTATTTMTTITSVSRDTQPTPAPYKKSNSIPPGLMEIPIKISATTHRTTGACTKDTSTSGSCKYSESETMMSALTLTTHSKSEAPLADYKANTSTNNKDWVDHVPDESEFGKMAYTRSDSNSAHSSSSLSQNSSFDEFKESDWKEVSRTAKLAVFELVVPNSYCGRVIGKGGKKINYITEESGGQITIDKPAGNIIPAERVISVKGQPQCAEKARFMITCALNTPSLNLAETSIQVTTKQLPHTAVYTQPILQTVSPAPTNDYKKTRPSTARVVTADIPVTPLLSYSKVATGSVSLEEIGKQLRAQQTCFGTEQDGTKFNTSVISSNEHQSTKDTSSHASDSFASKDFSYFTTSDSTTKASSEQNQDLSSFVQSNQQISKETNHWKVSTENDNALDRNRSISWTGQPKAEMISSLDSAGNRSMSTEAISDRQGLVTSPWTMLQHRVKSAEELSDEQVFDDTVWPSKSKVDESLPSATEVWELSSSPTSSVSSSKVELANILDNDSGLSSSNPLGPTPPSLQSDSRISFQEQAYLDTASDSNTWLQSRGAYSAPSSPALQRNNGNKSRAHSPKSKSIRSHPSMDELNNSRPWKRSLYTDTRTWPERPLSPPQHYQNKNRNDVTRDTNHDSGLSSPHQLTDKRKPSVENDTIAVTSSTTQWSAERFQDVQNLSDLMEHLSLDKYTAKLKENSMNLETLLSLSERDLQNLGIPKGPRLKILKACDIVKSQQRPLQQSQIQQQTHVTIETSVPSSQTFFPVVPAQNQQHIPMDPYNNKQMPFTSPYGYPDLLPYSVQQTPYNVIIPNSQSFIHNMQQPFPMHQTQPPAQTIYTSAQDFGTVGPQLTDHNGGGIMPPQYVYPDNQAFYFYPPPQN